MQLSLLLDSNPGDTERKKQLKIIDLITVKVFTLILKTKITYYNKLIYDDSSCDF